MSLMIRWLLPANAYTLRKINLNGVLHLKNRFMIKHVVTFKFKGTPEERNNVAKKFAEALVQLPDAIPELKSMEVGINMNPAERWDLVLTAIANTMEDVATYSAHPAHQAAVAIIAPYKEDRACVDYEF